MEGGVSKEVMFYRITCVSRAKGERMLGHAEVIRNDSW